MTTNSAYRAMALTAALLTIGAIATNLIGPRTPSAAAAVSEPWIRVDLHVDDRVVPVTLTDTPAARSLATMLPLRLDLRDTWGQAKAGRLPQPLSPDGTERITRPVPGGVYYSADASMLAVFYDDLGQSVPAPGLIRLGSIDAGLDRIATIGRHGTVRIAFPGATSS